MYNTCIFTIIQNERVVSKVLWQSFLGILKFKIVNVKQIQNMFER